MLHDRMLSSEPSANDKVLIQAKGTVHANNRVRWCTDSPVKLNLLGTSKFIPRAVLHVFPYVVRSVSYTHLTLPTTPYV